MIKVLVLDDMPIWTEYDSGIQIKHCKTGKEFMDLVATTDEVFDIISFDYDLRSPLNGISYLKKFLEGGYTLPKLFNFHSGYGQMKYSEFSGTFNSYNGNAKIMHTLGTIASAIYDLERVNKLLEYYNTRSGVLNITLPYTQKQFKEWEFLKLTRDNLSYYVGKDIIIKINERSGKGKIYNLEGKFDQFIKNKLNDDYKLPVDLPRVPIHSHIVQGIVYI